MTDTKRVTLTLPEDVYNKVEEKRGYIKRSTYIAILLERAIEHGIQI